jgi:hypothetical protein
MTDEVQPAGRPLKVTLKAGPGYEAPWITVEADTPAQLASRLDALADAAAPAAVNASQALQAVYAAARGLDAKVTRTERQEEPRQEQAQTGGAPDGAPTCVHGPMIRRTGTSGKGPWGAYFCPQPKNATDKCEPIWDKKK